MDDFDKFYLQHEGPKVRGFVFRWLVTAFALAVSAWIDLDEGVEEVGFRDNAYEFSLLKNGKRGDFIFSHEFGRDRSP